MWLGRTETLRIARRAGLFVVGVDAHEDAIRAARAGAEHRGLAARARFEQLDASRELPFGDRTFDAVTCIDAPNHLPDRPRVLAEWARVLRPGGRVLFTDPIVVTGALTHEEIAIRSSVGFFLVVPPELDARLLREAGFGSVTCTDRTENMARLAARRHAARAARARELRAIEGDSTDEGQQRFFEVAARLAAERRLSRFALGGVRE